MLKKLLDAGVISRIEFDTQKAKLLGRYGPRTQYHLVRAQ
ncbi:MAG: SHOCT domain-containing protein [Janthinobacterium lividum]